MIFYICLYNLYNVIFLSQLNILVVVNGQRQYIFLLIMRINLDQLLTEQFDVVQRFQNCRIYARF